MTRTLSEGARVLSFSPPRDPDAEDVEYPHEADGVSITVYELTPESTSTVAVDADVIHDFFDAMPRTIEEYRPRARESISPHEYWVRFKLDPAIEDGEFHRVDRNQEIVTSCHWCGRAPEHYAVTVHRGGAHDLKFCTQFCHDDWSFERAVDELKRSMPGVTDDE